MRKPTQHSRRTPPRGIPGRVLASCAGSARPESGAPDGPHRLVRKVGVEQPNRARPRLAIATRFILLGLVLAFPIAPVAEAQAGAMLAPEPLPIEERLDQAWRWRELPLSEKIDGLWDLESTAPGQVFGLDRMGVVSFNGVDWKRISTSVADTRKSRLTAVKDGLIIGDPSRLQFLPTAEGAGWSLQTEHMGSATTPPCSGPGDSIFFASGEQIVAVSNGSIQAQLDGPREGEPILSLGYDGLGRLWCLTVRALYRCDMSNWNEALPTPRDWTALPIPASLIENSALGRMLISGELVYFLPHNTQYLHQLSYWDGERVQHLPFDNGGTNIPAAVITKDGSLLVATLQGKLWVHRDQDWMQVDPRALGGNRAHSLCMASDDQGHETLVLVTSSGKVYACDLDSKRWRSFDPSSAGLWSNVHAMAPARQGGLWIGTGRGIARFDGREFHEPTVYAGDQLLSTVTSIVEDEEGDLWVGSGGSFTGVHRRQNGRWSHLEPESMRGLHVHQIRRGPQSELWFLLLGNTYNDPPTGGVALFADDRFEAVDLPSGRFYDVAFDVAGNPTLAGLSTVFRRGEQSWFALGEPSKPRTNFVLHFDRSQTLWRGHGYQQGGLEIFSSGSWLPAPTPQLARASALSISEGADGRLWFASDRGLFSYFDGASQEITQEPGLETNDFWPSRPDGQGGLWLGSLSQGVIHYQPDDHSAPIFSKLTTELDASGSATAVIWAAIDPWSKSPPESLSYRTRINGGAWSPWEQVLSRKLTDFGSGQYNFEIEVSDLAGNRSRYGKPFAVMIAPPRWKRPLVVIPLAVSILTLTALIGFMRHRKREREFASEHERNAIRASEEHYRSLVDRADLTLACFGRDGQLEYISPHVEQLTGYKPEEFLRDPSLESKIVHPADARRLQVFVAARDHRYVSPCTLEEELRLRHRDGSWRWVYVKQSPHFDAAEDLVGFDSLAYDITARVELEKALRESEEQFRRIVETCNEGVWILDGSACTRYLNAQMASMLGAASPDEVLGQGLDNFLSCDDRRTFIETTQRATHLAPKQCQLTLSLEDGNSLQVIANVSHIGGREDWKTLAMVVDISRYVQAEEALRHSQKLESLGVLAGGVAHDFNNLLTVVLGNAELAKRKLRGDPSAILQIQKIEYAAHRAADFCQQLLAFAGRANIDMTMLNIGELVVDMLRLLSTSIPKTVALETSHAGFLPNVTGDAGQLSQVLMNLVLNAAEAIGEEDGRISVETSLVNLTREEIETSLVPDRAEPGAYICLAVSDSGCGLDESSRGKIFDPFFTTKFTGRGLGLAAVRGIIRSHRGTMTLTSEVGVGSEFRIYLPVATEAAGASIDYENSFQAAVQGTVLVVDDEFLVRTVGREMLESLGYQVLTAENGHSALQIYSENADTISAVLLDMTMPDRNGVEVLSDIRKVRSDACVVIASGYSTQEYADRFEIERPQGFIQKPFTREDLRLKLAAAIANGA